MSFNFMDSSIRKCGEIYSRDDSQLTIVCTCCELRMFDFKDFLHHLQRVHSFQGESKYPQKTLKQVEEQKFLQECLPEEQELFFDELLIPSIDENDTEIFDDEAEYLPDEQECPTEELLIPLTKRNDPELCSDNDHHDNRISTKNSRKCKGGAVRKDKTKLKRQKKEQHSAENVKENHDLPQGNSRHSRKLKNIPSSGSSSRTDHISRRMKNAVETYVETCTICDLEIQDKADINCHYLTEHGGFPCSECGKKFKNKGGLASHMKMHSDEPKPFICEWENCGKTCSSSLNLRRHADTHLNPKNYICEVCGYSCRKPESLRVHIRGHTGERPYPCPDCGKCFKSKQAVITHQESHTQERPFVCNICGACFSRKKSLYHHKHLHNGKQFKCKICDKPFAQLPGLSMHMRKHKEGTLFS